MAVIMVLLAISTVLGVGYVLISTAASSAAMGNNASLASDARTAAFSGAAIAFRNMNNGTWGGLGSSYSQSLGTGISYTATYTQGDDSLPANHADQPYLVTITVDATVENGVPGTADAHHTTEFVVRLVPKTPDPQPSDWATFMDHSVYQTHEFDSTVYVPARIEGKVRFQKKLILCNSYPNDTWKQGGKRVLMVVRNPSSLTAEEQDRKTFLEDENFTVTLIDESASQASFDAAVATNDVVYIPEEIISGQVNTKASNLTIGVVNEEVLLYDELGAASSGIELNDRQLIQMVDVSSEITKQYNLLELRTIYNVEDHATGITGTKSPDLKVLATSIKVGQSTYDALGTLEAADETWDSGYTTSRRVQLPFGGTNLSFASVDADGRNFLCRSLEWAAQDNPRRRLFRDLAVNHHLNVVDQRPFSGDVYLPFLKQGNDTVAELQGYLDLNVYDMLASNPAGDWVTPTSFTPTTYKLYSEGKTYSAVALTGNTLTNTTLTADPETNPLGIFTYGGDLTIQSNVTIQGTLLVGGKLDIDGTNIQITPVTMESTDPDLYAGMRIPTLVVEKSLNVKKASQVTAEGAIVCFEDFTVEGGAYSTQILLTGKVVCGKQFKIDKRDEWNSCNFNNEILNFMNQSTHNRFPDYLNSIGVNPTANIAVLEAGSDYEYHWIDPDSPDNLYQPSGGGGEFEYTLVRMR